MFEDEKDASRSFEVQVNKRGSTHDCAFLEPLAFPPDLPPVILMDLDLFGGNGWAVEVELMDGRGVVDGVCLALW